MSTTYCSHCGQHHPIGACSCSAARMSFGARSPAIPRGAFFALATLGLALIAAGLWLGCSDAGVCDLSTPSVLSPSRTPVPAPSLTPSPTRTPIPTRTSTRTPAASVTPTRTSAPTACLDDSEFVTDVTVPDDTRFNPGEVFTKTWRVRNTGSCVWSAGYEFFFLKGDRLDGPDAVALAGPVVPGAEADLSVRLRAPSTSGSYFGRWQMRNPAGQAFGTRPYVRIVVSSASVNPAPTARPSGSSGAEPNLGKLRLDARLSGIRPVGNGQCVVDFYLHASGGTGLYSYYRDKDVEDPNFKIVDRHPGDYTYSTQVPNAWGGAVGFIVWSGFQHPQRATASVWVDARQVVCP